MMFTHVKRVLLALTVGAFTFLAVTECLGDPDPENTVTLDRPWAVQLQLLRKTNDLTGPLDWGRISLKRHSSARSAWRLDLEVRVSSEESDEPLIAGRARWSVKNEFIGLSLLKLWHTGPKRSFLAFAGIGPSAGYGHHQFEDNTGLSRTTALDATGWIAGARATAGAEWFVLRRLSLLAELGLIAGMSFESSKQTRRDAGGTQSQSHDSYGFEFDDTGIGIGLAVHF